MEQKTGIYDRERARSYYNNVVKNNPELILKRRECFKRYYRSNKEKAAARQLAYVAKNKEKLIQKRKEKYKITKEIQIRSATEWRLRNKERSARTMRNWRKNNPDKNYYYAHKRRALIKNASFDSSAMDFYKSVKSNKYVICYWCGIIIQSKDCDIDHMVAISLGGNHAASNLCASCKECNQKKHDKPLDKWMKEISFHSR